MSINTPSSPYRLGLDVGSNSIGWCAVKLTPDEGHSEKSSRYRPSGVLDAGVRILTPNEEAGREPGKPGKTPTLAKKRRDKRSARRRRDRFVRRQKRLMQVLAEAGLMPKAEEKIPHRETCPEPFASLLDAKLAKEGDSACKALEKLDPYWLRVVALDERLEPYELGRAIFHLGQRRGFKSNRLADSDDNEKSAMKTGMRDLQEALDSNGARTLGEFLAKRHRRDKHGNRVDDSEPESVRFRPTAQGAKNLYEFYPTRDMIESELDEIWKHQRPHHDQLTDDVLTKIKRAVIEQRDLKKPIVGRCTLRPELNKTEQYGLEIDLGERAPKAHPLFQRFRILQDVSQLMVTRPGKVSRPLTLQERDAIVGKLMSQGGNNISFEKLRKAAKFPDDARFNYELSGRGGFQPDQTAAKLGMNKAFGKQWRSIPRKRQIEIVERLLATENPDKLIDWLQSECGLDAEKAEAVSETRLPQGYGAFGRGVLADLVKVMEAESVEDHDRNTGEVYARPILYSEAVQKLDLHHSDLRGPGDAARLAYYGEVLPRHVISKPDAPKGSQENIGRVPNPTVHIGLNQIRKIVNALIDEYGPPTEIVIELARELKLNKKRKDEIQRENRENEKKNADRKALLERLGVADTYDARLRLRLFDELPADERVCVFSGKPLSVEKLFDGSTEIEHILPHSQTLDDSFMNKVLCSREANRRKGNRAPAEAWSGEELQAIVERAERLFQKKAWRFQPDAMKRFEADGGFLARQLIDTQHMARLAKTYLEQVCGQVWAPPGRLTAMLRAKWGLNSLLPDHNFTDANQPKNRKDHRHHAIDAFVVACTDRGLINRIARASGQAEELDIDRLFPKDSFPEPYDGFRDDLFVRLETLIISHKLDHGLPPGTQSNVHVTSGQLHEETAYGLVDEEIDGKHYNLVMRKAVDALTKNEIGRIRDDNLRAELQQVAYEAEGAGKKLSDALAEFGEEKGIRRVRILKTEKSVRIVRHGNGFTKAYSPGGNHRVEIYELPDGEWAGEGVTMYDANQPEFTPVWKKENPQSKLVMRVHNGDLIEGDFGEGRRVCRVYRLEPSAKRIRLAYHNEAGSIDQRHNDSEDPLRWIFGTYARLKEAKARRVRVDVLGRIHPAKDK